MKGAATGMAVEAYAALPRGRHPLSREYVGRHQRERMVRAVVELAHEEGLAAVTVTGLTARARISRKTFYDYFADQEECVDHVGETAMAHLSEPVGLKALLDAVASEPLLAEMALVHAPALGGERGRRFQEIAVEAVAGLVSADDGELGARAEASASAVIGVIAHRLRRGEAVRMGDLSEAAAGLAGFWATIDTAAQPGDTT